MKQNCFRILRLINNLIDITKIDAGYLNLNIINCNIVSIIEDITLSVAEYVESKKLNIIFDTEVEEINMACDPDKIERIILNLISNSIKFTQPGGSIFVNIYSKKDKVSVSIKDTGQGIPEDKLEMIFERFRQVNKSLTRENEGSGIGLSLVKSLVELHSGTIEVKSKLGFGSEFIITLPVKLVDSNPKTAVLAAEYKFKEKIERINIEFSDIY